MAYEMWRMTIARSTMERYAGALAIYSKTQRASLSEETDSAVKLDIALDAQFAAGASAALRTMLSMDGEVDPDTFAQMVMAMAGGGE